MTRISVTFPNYNHGRFLGSNIEGLQRQTFGDWELIIVDDGSTDDSWAVIERYRQADPRIKAERFAQNRGAVAAYRRCCELAGGELLFASSADDYVIDRDFFAEAIAALARHPQAAGVGGKSRVVDAESNEELWLMGSAPWTGYIGAKAALEAFLLGELFLPGASAIWKRSLVERLGAVDPALGPQADYFVNHGLAATHGVVFLDKALSVTRGSKTSYGATRSDAEYFTHHAMVEKHLCALELPCAVAPQWRLRWRVNVVNGRLAAATQKRFVRGVRAHNAGIRPWERGALSERFRDLEAKLLGDCDAIEGEIDARIRVAQKIFDETAGRLAGLPELASAVEPGPGPLAGILAPLARDDFTRRAKRWLARKLHA
jgi:hypothetical protein